ncbi:MBL fold metallo-hydrolase [Streptococcus hillyeri]|uniref:MBL fold metallo-hydrolase n=1 Tax=Streptococcus hillyeri TaxID=2282420 RepID=A0A3L9DV84_9STRE|nr:MBL fold metallo-hydrolase [Streptococcus hillyeri]RLY05396.1 MBL fold metallo-hydrolase [Streptococcus hillyeri]
MSTTIESIEYFACGYCINNKKNLFKGVPKGSLHFPAGVFLIKHREHGYILYDTGYAPEIMAKTWKYALYRLPNPIVMTPADSISEQLKKRGISPDAIRYLILSHLHPDHIGQVKAFPKANIILTKTCLQEYRANRFSSLIFKEFLPLDFEKRVITIETYQDNRDFPHLPSYDFFGDQSILMTELSGHSDGQCCLFFPEKRLFLAADVAWGVPLIPLTKRMRLIPRLLQNNIKQYQRSIQVLEHLQQDGIKIIVSHDQKERIERVLR